MAVKTFGKAMGKTKTNGFNSRRSREMIELVEVELSD